MSVDLQRRELLLILGGSLLAGYAEAQALSSPAPSGTSPRCIVTPRQTEGPYFADTRLHRSDIRADPPGGPLKPGVPLTLALRVQAVRDNTCSPLANAMVDVWHCDAQGRYSGIDADKGETAFLRGYQITDEKGYVRFRTIYPGWYPGRAVHIHFKIRTKDRMHRPLEFTSQLYFDDAITARAHTHAPYSRRRGYTPVNERDRLFLQGGGQLMLALEKADQGYAGRFDIGLQIA